MRRVLLCVVVAAVSLLAVGATSASAAFDVNSFTTTPSTTEKLAHPSLTIQFNRTGSASEDLRDVTTKLPTGMTLVLPPAAQRCSSTAFALDSCPAGSSLGSVSLNATLTLFGSSSVANITGSLDGLADGKVGVTLRPDGLGKSMFKQTLSTASSRVSIASTSFPRTFTVLGFPIVDLTVNSLSYSYSGSFVTNPSTCGTATSNLTAVSYQSVSVARSASFAVTGCAPPPDTTAPVITITQPLDGSVVSSSSVVLAYTAIDDRDGPITNCNIPNGSTITLNPGPNTITVTCVDLAGNVGTRTITVTYTPAVPAPNTVLGDALPALPTLTPTIPVSTDTGAAYECRVNDMPAGWATCNPNSGTYGAGLTFNDAATNKVEIRATNGTPDATPVTTYIWTDNDAAPSYTATITPSTTQAGAHPNLTSTVTVHGGWNAKAATVNVAPGFNAGLTAVSEECTFNADPNAMDCGTSAPGSLVGTVSGTGVSTSAGFLTDATGSLYMTTSPNVNSPAGVWLDVASPSHPELGRIRATAEARITQTNNGTSQGLIRQQLVIPSVPQRTNNGSRFHINSVSMNLQGDPAGGSHPLLTNPTSCPATPATFVGSGVTYGTDGLDSSSGPAFPSVTVPYPVTGCNTLPFNPTINQDFYAWDPIDGSAADPAAPVVQNIGSSLFTNDAIGGTRLAEFGVDTQVSLSAGSKAIQDIAAYEPAGLGVNLPAFGSSAQKCSGSGASPITVWTGGGCPASGVAEIGYMTIDTPLLDEPLVGRVKALGKTPIPWLGVEIAHNATWGATNPVGVTLRFTGQTNLEDPPGCTPAGIPHCTDSGHIKVSFTGLPDVPLTSAELDLSGQEARPLGLLSSLLLIGPDEGDPACVENDGVTTFFTPQGSTPGGADDVVRIQDTTISDCVPDDIVAPTVNITTPADGSTVSASPVTLHYTVVGRPGLVADL